MTFSVLIYSFAKATDDKGGPERIRTAVGAFAELCLATRPQDPFLKPVRK